MRTVEDGVDITIRVTLVALAGLLLVLVATGLWLTFEYRPMDQPVRTVHQVASWLALMVAVLPPAIAVVRRRSALVAVGVLFTAAMAAAAITGQLLPWDQLALFAVTVGTDISGVLDPFGDHIRLVLIGGAEVSNGAYQRAVVVHLGVLPVVLVVSGAVLARGFLLRR